MQMFLDTLSAKHFFLERANLLTALACLLNTIERYFSPRVEYLDVFISLVQANRFSHFQVKFIHKIIQIYSVKFYCVTFWTLDQDIAFETVTIDFSFTAL